MQTVEYDRTTTSSGVKSRGAFAISAGDEVHIMRILRDTLYSDKILAPLREYASNAWDAHRMVGKGHVPIKVTIPTLDDPTLVIRDYGPGISEDDIFDVFTKYGASTKRNTNEAVGCLGLGCKSAYAYSDTFTVTSWWGGKKKVYVAALDESDAGVMQKLFEEPCRRQRRRIALRRAVLLKGRGWRGPRWDRGVEIRIPVRPRDIPTFETRAKEFFALFDPKPDINIELPSSELEHTSEFGGLIFSAGARGDELRKRWFVVMGCVPYRLDLNMIEDELKALGREDLTRPKFGGVVRVDIGQVEINASREALKYNDHTRKVVAERLVSVVENGLQKAFAAVQNRDGVPWWSRRILWRSLVSMFGVKPPLEFAELTTPLVKLPVHPDLEVVLVDTMEPHKGKAYEKVSVVEVVEGLRIYIHDDGRDLRGFKTTRSRYMALRRKDQQPVSNEDLESFYEVMDTAKISGLPMEPLSTKSWSDPIAPVRAERVKGTDAKQKDLFKYKRLCFELDLDSLRSGGTSVRSAHWRVSQDEPTENDVVAILESFTVVDTGQGFLSSDVRNITMLLKKMGGTAPRIFGVKRTTKNPVQYEDLPGTPIKLWFRKLCNELAEELLPIYIGERWSDLMSRLINLNSNGDMLRWMKLLPPESPARDLLVMMATWYLFFRKNREAYQQSGYYMLRNHENIRYRREEAERLVALASEYLTKTLGMASPEGRWYGRDEIPAWVHTATYLALKPKDNRLTYGGVYESPEDNLTFDTPMPEEVKKCCPM